MNLELPQSEYFEAMMTNPLRDLQQEVSSSDLLQRLVTAEAENGENMDIDLPPLSLIKWSWKRRAKIKSNTEQSSCTQAKKRAM